MKVRGLYRTKNGRATPDTVRCHNIGKEFFELSEHNYRVLGYEPQFDELPWKEDYKPSDG